MSEIDAKQPEPAPDSGTERRVDERHFACFPAHIQRPGGSTRMALIRDLSVSGALLYTRSRLAVGDELELNLYLREDATHFVPAPARVVRIEPLSADRSDVWHFRAAVCFAEPLCDCETEIKDIAARQAALGVPRD
jgi:hypothetical protein